MLYYKALEQEHSSPSSPNELSQTSLELIRTQESSLKKQCQLNSTPNMTSCKFPNIILLTHASTQLDIDHIIKSASLNFPYTIVCLSNTSSNLNPSSSLAVIFTNSTFSSCLSLAFKTGFKQQTFLIAKNLGSLSYWDDQLQAEPSASSELELEKSLASSSFLIRQNVANAIVRLKSNPVLSVCSFYQSNTEHKICEGLNKIIDELTWHKNDLASESCEGLDSSTVWIPDYHDGPRADITSTLVHLGQKPILAGYKRESSPYPDAIRMGYTYCK